MQGYETVVILDPNCSSEQRKEWLDGCAETLSKEDGPIVHHGSWGRRRLAYNIKKRDYGHYELLYHTRQPKALDALIKLLRYDERVLKWLTVAVDDVQHEYDAWQILASTTKVSKTDVESPNPTSTDEPQTAATAGGEQQSAETADLGSSAEDTNSQQDQETEAKTDEEASKNNEAEEDTAR